MGLGRARSQAVTESQKKPELPLRRVLEGAISQSWGEGTLYQQSFHAEQPKEAPRPGQGSPLHQNTPSTAGLSASSAPSGWKPFLCSWRESGTHITMPIISCKSETCCLALAIQEVSPNILASGLLGCINQDATPEVLGIPGSLALNSRPTPPGSLLCPIVGPTWADTALPSQKFSKGLERSEFSEYSQGQQLGNIRNDQKRENRRRVCLEL